HYNTGVFLYRTPIRQAHIRDGVSNTIFIGEVQASDKPDSSNRWIVAGRHTDSLRTTENALNTPPTKGITVDLYGLKVNGAFGSRHSGGAYFAFGDGHVQFISENINLPLYKALGTRAGRENASPPP
ncbi:MAG TPA: DUF1559 domain-containing protein, partial [Pirellulaceae bacterium]|nr:DUF1559 domain-containing protein [Pirellulaceae bacterium]